MIDHIGALIGTAKSLAYNTEWLTRRSGNQKINLGNASDGKKLPAVGAT